MINKSFSKGVKEELFKIIPEEDHCKKAEIAAIMAFCKMKESDDDYKTLIPNTDSQELIKKYFTLLSDTIKMSECEDYSVLIRKKCCKKAFLRGAFLASGSINDPNKSYHMEIVSDDKRLTDCLVDILSDLGISAKSTKRKSSYILYIKEATLIVDLIGVMGAHLSLMAYENVRILKGVRNDLNRRVNCEAANIRKTVSAALSQIEDIKFIETKVGLGQLPESLKKVAQLRLEYPEASLTELGEMIDPPVGKSGINHRLRRISIFAQKIKKEENT